MNNVAKLLAAKQVLMWLALLLVSGGSALAQDSEAASSHEGMTMLVLFLGIAGIIGVFVIRWSQSTGDDEDQA